MAIKMKKLIRWLFGYSLQPTQILKIPTSLLVVENRLWMNVELNMFDYSLRPVSHGNTTLLYNPDQGIFEGYCSTCGVGFHLPLYYFFGLNASYPIYFSAGEHYGKI